jgi:hypothetical protein
MFLETKSALQVEFNYVVSVLKDNVKDYDISRANLVISCTQHTFQFMHTL